ncbi:rhomboid family intramembrane serine protease [Aquimarina sp. RZ0]|uniref:rhomboid family protein n=1 Tax=Aquimarina sp. RZ0 TaxID=2607730 RepID=UPI0011F0A954|nr:rhomboid family intramembrane serine protease [Aquimarina sp. RZ0]KAA1245810.1 rhomboid family intramembrane serine protease [Aquimarina sp. RZ0]
MKEIGLAGVFLFIINGLITYKGLKNISFLRKYSFQVDEVLIHKDYKRLLTAGFLHVHWFHFGFNMLSLYFFSFHLETTVGVFKFIIIYFGSLIGGNLLALYIHRNKEDYSAVGASGAISGIIFASIALFEDLQIGFFFIPIGIPGWLYGLLFVLVSIYGIRSQRDSIGHEAHLGGGIIGLLIAITMVPNSIFKNYIAITLVAVPTIIFISIILIRPDFLIFKKTLVEKPEGLLDIDDKYNTEKVTKEQELNTLLDKINEKGIKKLSKAEKERLEELSR